MTLDLTVYLCQLFLTSRLILPSLPSTSLGKLAEEERIHVFPGPRVRPSGVRGLDGDLEAPSVRRGCVHRSCSCGFNPPAGKLDPLVKFSGNLSIFMHISIFPLSFYQPNGGPHRLESRAGSQNL